jgi:hypothetical protein
VDITQTISKINVCGTKDNRNSKSDEVSSCQPRRQPYQVPYLMVVLLPPALNGHIMLLATEPLSMEMSMNVCSLTGAVELHGHMHPKVEPHGFKLGI